MDVTSVLFIFTVPIVAVLIFTAVFLNIKVVDEDHFVVLRGLWSRRILPNAMGPGWHFKWFVEAVPVTWTWGNAKPSAISVNSSSNTTIRLATTKLQNQIPDAPKADAFTGIYIPSTFVLDVPLTLHKTKDDHLVRIDFHVTVNILDAIRAVTVPPNRDLMALVVAHVDGASSSVIGTREASSFGNRRELAVSFENYVNTAIAGYGANVTLVVQSCDVMVPGSQGYELAVIDMAGPAAHGVLSSRQRFFNAATGVNAPGVTGMRSA